MPKFQEQRCFWKLLIFADFHAIGEKLSSFLYKKIMWPQCEHLSLRFANAESEKQIMLHFSMFQKHSYFIDKVSDLTFCIFSLPDSNH